MMSTVRLAIGLLGLGCVSGSIGCDPGPENEVEPQLDERQAYVGWGCRKCGYTNSPMYGLHPIDRFADGSESAEAPVKLLALQDPAGLWHPAQVELEEFVATTPAGLVYGPALAGWRLILGDGVDEFSIGITSVEYHPDWVDEHLVATYALEYTDPSNPENTLNVCPGLPRDETTVLLLSGEHYDSASRTIVPDQPGLVTMACQGHALAKMKLMGYGPNDNYGSTWEQRQSTIKMITADYCGNGTSFTQVGQPLEWLDQLGHFLEEDMSGPAVVEAIWNKDGAVCLDQPRAVDRSVVEGMCTIPKCPEGNDLGGDDWMSLVP